MSHPFGQTPPEEIDAALDRVSPSEHCIIKNHRPGTGCVIFHADDIKRLLDALLYAFNQADSRELADWARDFRIVILAALGIKEVVP